MGFYLGTFTTWLRQALVLSDDVEILSDRAAIPKDRKRRPTTRWDHLAKQQSFTMPKVPSRRRLGDAIEEDTVTEETAKESCPPPTRRMNQASLSYPPRGGTSRPGLGAKQFSLRNLPSHSRTLNSRTEVEQMKMPRLVKQKSSRRVSDDDKSTGGRRGMKKQDSFDYSKRLSRREPNHRPTLPIRTQDSDSDEASDNASSTPLKQRSSTVARLLTRAPLIGIGEKGANGTCKQQQQMAKPDSLTMPKRPTRTLESDDEMYEKTDTLSSMPRLAKQMSFTVARNSSRTPLIGSSEKKGNVITPDSCSSPRRPSRTFDSNGELNEITETLPKMPRLVKQISFTVARHSSQTPLIGDDEHGGHVIVPNSPFSSPTRPIRTFDSEDEPTEKTDILASMPRLAKQGSFTIPILSSETLELEDESDGVSNAQPNSDSTHEQLGDNESDGDRNAQSNFDATPESSPHTCCLIQESKLRSDLQPSSDTTPEYSPHNSVKIHESKSTSDSLPQDLSTSDVDVVIETKLSSASNSSESPARQHLRLLGQSKAVDCTTESSEWTYHQRERLYTA